MMLILLDQDGPLADWCKGFDASWSARHPQRPLATRNNFEVWQDHPIEWKQDVLDIYKAPGFYLELDPVEGAIAGANALLEAGHDVRICTAPLRAWEHCVPEKYAWVERHMGAEWVRRIILTKDKTWVRGDVLIDDKPEITGDMRPTWTHVVFDEPYNQHVAGPRLSGWEDLPRLLSEIA